MRLCLFSCFPGSSDGKASAYNAGDPGSIPGSGRSPGEGNDNPFQYSCLENPMDRGAWWATVHGVAKSRTRLSDFTSLHFNKHLHSLSCKVLLKYLVPYKKLCYLSFPQYCVKVLYIFRIKVFTWIPLFLSIICLSMPCLFTL